MDILSIPQNPTYPVEKVPYVCVEKYDGGAFLSYPARKNLLNKMPPTKIELIRAGPYLELLYPGPKEDKEQFYQTWLFFGLIAEFLGMNKGEDGSSSIDSAEDELAALYTDYVYMEGNQKYIRAAKVMTLRPLMERSIRASKTSSLNRFKYLCECLETAHSTINHIHSEFDHTIKYALAALGELFSTAMNVTIHLYKLDHPLLSYSWETDFLRRGGPAEDQMLQMGWCPAEIERVKYSYPSFNAHYFLSRLDRRAQNWDHSKCTKEICSASQIDMSKYKVTHCRECACSEIAIDINQVISILTQGSSYPILKIVVHPESLELLEISVKPYERGQPYIALSHVWADGLGNPFANSLRRCQLANVEELIRKLEATISASSRQPQTFYLWIDTLCCPVSPAYAKKISIQKITDVYRNATHVLVLDSSLRGHPYESVHCAELLMRIFTSNWMRRLWTLQEGALAQSLYFQFSDRAANANDLLQQLYMLSFQDVRLVRFWRLLSSQIVRIQTFFHYSFISLKNDLPLLQSALEFRSVTVPSDEALCISTLMSLDLKYVQEVDDQVSRMCRVWELLDRSLGGIPSSVIFFEDDPIDLPGWRWAPRSLLTKSSSALDPAERNIRWAKNQEGSITKRGLKVRLPGMILRPRDRPQDMPLYPWEGINRVSQKQIFFKNTTTSKWYRLIDRSWALNTKKWSKEQLRQYHDTHKEPITKAIQEGNCALIQSANGLGYGSLVRVLAEEQEPNNSVSSLLVHKVLHVGISELSQSEVKVAETINSLAEVLREEETTRELLAVQDKDTEQYKKLLEISKGKMKDLMAETWENNHEFVQAVHDSLGANLQDHMWVQISGWFANDNLAFDVPADQIWYVD